MALVTDGESNKKSLMILRKHMCGGKEPGGYQCKHYWNFVKKVDSNNAYQLRLGETVRFCTYCPSYPLEWEGENELPVRCNRYDPDIARPYDPELEEYKPLSPEEVSEIIGSDTLDTQDEPDPNAIKNPSNWTSNMAGSPNHKPEEKSNSEVSTDDVMNAIDNQEATCGGIFNEEENDD